MSDRVDDLTHDVLVIAEQVTCLRLQLEALRRDIAMLSALQGEVIRTMGHLADYVNQSCVRCSDETACQGDAVAGKSS